jgi:hypothetical protein
MTLVELRSDLIVLQILFDRLFREIIIFEIGILQHEVHSKVSSYLDAFFRWLALLSHVIFRIKDFLIAISYCYLDKANSLVGIASKYLIINFLSAHVSRFETQVVRLVTFDANSSLGARSHILTNFCPILNSVACSRILHPLKHILGYNQIQVLIEVLKDIWLCFDVGEV